MTIKLSKLEINSKLRHLHKVPNYNFTHKYCVLEKKQVHKDNYLNYYLYATVEVR